MPHWKPLHLFGGLGVRSTETVNDLLKYMWSHQNQIQNSHEHRFYWEETKFSPLETKGGRNILVGERSDFPQETQLHKISVITADSYPSPKILKVFSSLRPSGRKAPFRIQQIPMIPQQSLTQGHQVVARARETWKDCLGGQ